MYVKDGICYAEDKSPDNTVEEVKYIGRGMVLVGFSTGETRLLDTTNLDGSVFKPLSDESIVSDVSVVRGGIAWNNGSIDISSDTAYELSEPYTPSERNA